MNLSPRQLLAGIVMLAAVTGLGSIVRAAVTIDGSTVISTNGVTAGDACLRVLSRCTVNAAGARECVPYVEDIPCGDAFCMNPSNVCYIKNPTSSSRSSSSASSAIKIVDPNACVRRAFECADGSSDGNCFKRMRSRDVRCTDAACIGASCVSRDAFLATGTFAPWDTGALPGPFPRTETMCVIKRTECRANDATCLSDVSFEQISCDDPLCARPGACDRIAVRVDERDVIVRTESSSSTQSSSVSRVPATETNGVPETSSGRAAPFGFDFPSFDTTPDRPAGEPISVRTLGCFAADGTWTTDRSRCDANQLRFIEAARLGDNPPSAENVSASGPIEESAVRETIDKRFFPTEEVDRRARTLIEANATAVDRLTVILGRDILRQDEAQRIRQTIDVLQVLQGDIANDTFSLDDIARDSGEARAKVEEAQTIVLSALSRTGSPITRSPDVLLEKADRIFGVIPSAFALMQGQGVVLTQDMLNMHLDAQSIYASIKPSCETNHDSCERLADVIAALEPLIADMKQAIAEANKPELEEQIDGLFSR